MTEVACLEDRPSIEEINKYFKYADGKIFWKVSKNTATLDTLELKMKRKLHTTEQQKLCMANLPH